MKMSRYNAEYWRDRAEETRTMSESMRSEEARRILAEIAADYDLFYDLALKQSGPWKRQQAIDVLVSSPFSASTRVREPEE